MVFGRRAGGVTASEKTKTQDQAPKLAAARGVGNGETGASDDYMQRHNAERTAVIEEKWLNFRVLLVVLGLLFATTGFADESLDVSAELSRPGVRVLVVEFYATWCKPCMEAVPKWKALHQKYRDRGLRFVVVAVQDDGRCTNPGWSPDRMICDEDGRISNSFKVGQRLPAAFAWSWNGRLLAQRSHVVDVEKVVERELNAVPRVAFSPPDPGPDAETLAKVIEQTRSELRRNGKLDVVANESERKFLDRARRATQSAAFADHSQCKLGEELAANSLIRLSIQRAGAEPKLLLQLLSLETGCLQQSGVARWQPKNMDTSVTEAVGDLLARLRPELQMPAREQGTATPPLSRSEPAADVRPSPNAPAREEPHMPQTTAPSQPVRSAFSVDSDPKSDAEIERIMEKPRAKFRDIGNGLVRQDDNGLLWQKSDSPDDIDLDNAKDYCKTLQLGGQGGWRLPSAEELWRTYGSEKELAPEFEFQSRGFLSMGAGSTWSVTPKAGERAQSWWLAKIPAMVVLKAQDNDRQKWARARCVKSPE